MLKQTRTRKSSPSALPCCLLVPSHKSLLGRPSRQNSPAAVKKHVKTNSFYFMCFGGIGPPLRSASP
ncbi:hypothetical protein ATPR_1442 [Acetobacter tropicalis NBRC 101654]|uniref:Uncharacterized protein n=1 Tax=Acetobacter tropicalis NBRC 101654 TaxID=749388 RepID=F7VDJ3_9PROT|nr:hypothetical protein ATPR_1442 [Acetobacter tropicalis NBRC 101654]